MPLSLLLKKDPVRLSGVKTLDPRLPCLLFKLAPEGGVIMVLDVVIGPSWQMLRYLGPFVTVDCMVLQYQSVFLFGPAIFLDFRVKMVVPSNQRLNGSTAYLSRHCLPILPSRNWAI